MFNIVIKEQRDLPRWKVSLFQFRLGFSPPLRTGRDPCIATPHSDQGQRTRSQNGPQPIHDVVVSAVAAAVMAATIIFNSTSQKLFLFIRFYFFVNNNYFNKPLISLISLIFGLRPTCFFSNRNYQKLFRN